MYSPAAASPSVAGIVGDTDVTDCSVATADGDRQAIGKNLVDKRGDRLGLRGAVGAHKQVAVGMPLVAFKADSQVAVSAVHYQDERPVRT